MLSQFFNAEQIIKKRVANKIRFKARLITLVFSFQDFPGRKIVE